MSSKRKRALGAISAYVMLGGLIAGCWLPASPAGAVVYPSLHGLTFSPSTVNITAGPAAVTAQIKVIDAPGLASGCISLDKPTTGGFSYTGTCFDASNRISGNATAGTYQVTLTIRQFAHIGFYPVHGLSLTDVNGVSSVYDQLDLAILGYAQGVHVAGTSDVTPPALVSVSFSNTSADLANGPFTAVVTAHVTDAQSGYTGSCIDFATPQFPTSSGIGACLIDPRERISGTPQDGIYQTTFTLPQTSVPGVYPIFDYHLQDDALNFVNLTPSQLVSAGAPAALTLTNSNDSAPGAPTAVTATPAASSAHVSWSAPASNGGATLIGYTVTATPGGQTATVNGSTTAANVPGLTNGTPYTFTVHATNGIGSSGESAASNSVTPALSPLAPSGVQAVASANQATVSWTPPTGDGGSPITGYKVTESDDLCGPNARACATATVTPDVTSVNLTGLLNGTPYTFTVHATNAIGNGPESAPSNEVTTPAGVSTAPQYVSGLAQTKQASLQWLGPDNNGGSAITSYTIVAAPGGQSITVPATPTGSQHGTITGLSNAVDYTFTVVATNAFGDSPASAPSATIHPSGNADAPTDVHAVADGAGSATISWTAPFDEGSPIYDYRVTAIPGGQIADVSPPATSLTMTGLNPGSTYTFTVSGSNGGGEGVLSEPSNAVVISGASKPAQPTAPNVVSGNASSATGALRVTYAAPANGGAAITKVTATCTSTNGGATRTGVHVGPTAAPITVSGAAIRKTYTCTVTATNAVGTGTASAPSAAVIVGTPGQPARPAVSRVRRGLFKVTVAKPVNNGAAVTKYLTACISSNGGVSRNKTSASATATIGGLTAGKAYYCVVRATNSRGNGATSLPSKSLTA